MTHLTDKQTKIGAVAALVGAIAIFAFASPRSGQAPEETSSLAMLPPTTAKPPPQTTQRVTTTRHAKGPSLSLFCPPPDTGDWDWYMASFDLDVVWNDGDFESATIDYGDGHSYSSATQADAEKNMLWHKYQEPGSFNVRVSILDTSGHLGVSSCTFSWDDIGVVVPQAITSSGCDPNYSGCVPIDSDVDCAGGSGNGPSYVRGPVTVLGSDIYGLDRNNDGIGCE